MAKSQDILQIEGVENLIAMIDRLGFEANAVVPDAALDGIEVFREAANRLAPGPHIEVAIDEATDGYAEAIAGPDEEHWYYRFFEYGAAAHTVTPGSKEALRFVSDSGEIFAMSVQHPGMAAQPFLRPAFDEHKDEAAKAAGDRFRKSLEKVARSAT